MVAKGRDASDLFPAVVKNVVSKNIEVKKLVYVYLGCTFYNSLPVNGRI